MTFEVQCNLALSTSRTSLPLPSPPCTSLATLALLLPEHPDSSQSQVLGLERAPPVSGRFSFFPPRLCHLLRGALPDPFPKHSTHSSGHFVVLSCFFFNMHHNLKWSNLLAYIFIVSPMVWGPWLSCSLLCLWCQAHS